LLPRFGRVVRIGRSIFYLVAEVYFPHVTRVCEPSHIAQQRWRVLRMNKNFAHLRLGSAIGKAKVAASQAFPALGLKPFPDAHRKERRQHGKHPELG
jgi:hypothetical protein